MTVETAGTDPGSSVAALRLENVHKSFGKTEVLRGVDLAVDGARRSSA